MLEREVGMWWMLVACGGPPADAEILEGDVVFQDSRSAQSAWIKDATDSPWSHVGVVVELGDQRLVLEAVQPVRLTPWDEWKARDDGVFGVRRVTGLNETDRAVLVAAGQKMLGRDYDPAFDWDDERLYCSELVTKLFETVGVTLGRRERVDDFPLDVAQLGALQRRGIPLDRVVVTPASIWDDDDLQPIGQSGRPR